MSRIVGVIPARYHSSRFPGKPLTLLLGKPMVIWVTEIAIQALGQDNVFVATDDQRIMDCVQAYGYQTLLTSGNALTGTDRLYEVTKKVDADIYVNIQGDEPLLNPVDITRIVEVKKKYPGEVINGMCLIDENEDPYNFNIPKVITTEDKRLVYMSRSPLPGFKDAAKKPSAYWKQVCIYAFTSNELSSFYHFGRKSYLESFEDIEILRFLDLNIPIRMVETTGSSLAVDIRGDKQGVEEALKRMQEQ